MHVYVEAADYPCKLLKNSFNGSRLCVKHALVRGFESMPPTRKTLTL